MRRIVFSYIDNPSCLREDKETYRMTQNKISNAILFVHKGLIKICVGLEVLSAARMTMAVFWGVAPCSLVEVY
jgi:hypothetical protein